MFRLQRYPLRIPPSRDLSDMQGQERLRRGHVRGSPQGRKPDLGRVRQGGFSGRHRGVRGSERIRGQPRPGQGRDASRRDLQQRAQSRPQVLPLPSDRLRTSRKTSGSSAPAISWFTRPIKAARTASAGAACSLGGNHEEVPDVPRERMPPLHADDAPRRETGKGNGRRDREARGLARREERRSHAFLPARHCPQVRRSTPNSHLFSSRERAKPSAARSNTRNSRSGWRNKRLEREAP